MKLKLESDNQNGSTSNQEVTSCKISILQSLHTSGNWAMLATAVIHLYDTGQARACRALYSIQDQRPILSLIF